MDNLNVHCSEPQVRSVAGLEGIAESTLGAKGMSGILKSMASRQGFLMERSHRVRFMYTPKHSSRLKQIEIVFGIVHRRAIVRASFNSLDALKQRLPDFIDYFNRAFARPFRWTCTGRPVKVQETPRPWTRREKWTTNGKTGKELALVS